MNFPKVVTGKDNVWTCCRSVPLWKDLRGNMERSFVSPGESPCGVRRGTATHLGSSCPCLAGAYLRQFYSLSLKEAVCVTGLWLLRAWNGRTLYHPCPVILWSHGFHQTSQGHCEIKGINGCRAREQCLASSKCFIQSQY